MTRRIREAVCEEDEVQNWGEELRRGYARKKECGGARDDVFGNVASTAPAKALDGGGVADARRQRSQRETIRDVMLAASDCGTWLTLGELRALTSYGEASISAQLRHLKKSEYGGYDLLKRHREDAMRGAPGEFIWEYQLTRCGHAVI